MTRLFGRSGMAMVAALLFAAGCGGSTAKDPKTAASESGDQHAEVGKPAPDLAIQSVNGKGKISLESLQGKIVIVDFWATWCAPCKESFPKLEALSKKLGDKVAIVGVSVDDDKNGINEFAKATGATFALGWDDGHALANKWNVKTMPTTFIVDVNGKVRFIHGGYHDGETDKMSKEVSSIADETPSGDTRVAKADKPADPSPAKTDDAKPDDKTASKDDASSDDPPPPPPKKKIAKGKAGAKKSPPKKGATTKKRKKTEVPAPAT